MSRQEQKELTALERAALEVEVIETTGVELVEGPISPLWAALPFVSVEPEGGAVVPFAATLRRVS
jgi:hypothetical protein